MVRNRRHSVCWEVVSSAGMERGKEGMARCPAIHIFLTVSQRQHDERGKVRLKPVPTGCVHSRRGGPPRDIRVARTATFIGVTKLIYPKRTIRPWRMNNCERAWSPPLYPLVSWRGSRWSITLGESQTGGPKNVLSCSAEGERRYWISPDPKVQTEDSSIRIEERENIHKCPRDAGG